MNERYSRLFALPNDLYTAGSPVVIAAGALLKDNQTGKVLAQLKLRSINPKCIKAVKVCITPMDTVGRILGEAVKYQYLDLNISRDTEFGQKSAILLPDPSIRSYTVIVEEVAFTDNTIWANSNNDWQSLPRPTALISEIREEELVKQYQLTYGKQCRFSPLCHEDLWVCSCGAVNRTEEETCHSCHLEYDRLLSVQWAALKEEKDIRVAAEKAEAQRLAAEKQMAAIIRAKTIRYSLLTVAVLAVTVYCLMTFLVIPTREYNTAFKLLEAGKLDEAIEAFQALDGFKDSTEQIEKAESEKIYQQACTLFADEQFSEAEDLFLSLGEYRDSAAQAQAVVTAEKLKKVSAYQNALQALAYAEQNNPAGFQFIAEEEILCTEVPQQNRLYEVAYRLFVQAGDYEDAEEYAERFRSVTMRYTDSDNDTGTFSYDEKGYLIREAYSNDEVYTYTYNTDGQKIGSTTQINNEWFENHSYIYDERGNLVQEDSYWQVYGYSFEDKYLYSYTYNDRGDIIKQVEKIYEDGIFSSTVVEEYAYTYNAAGNILQKTTTRTSVSSTVTTIEEFTYDDRGYLTNMNSQSSDGKRRWKNFTNDSNGNIIKTEVISSSGQDELRITDYYGFLYIAE